MIRTALRRSAALPALPVLLAIVVAHIALRPRLWAHEWFWAIYQFNFVTILIGPLLAGVAAWEGWRCSAAADLLDTGAQPRRVAAVTWLATLLWGLLVFVVGLVSVGIIVRVAGTPGAPPLAALASVLPAMGLLAAECAVGLLIGWWVRHVLAAPAAAVGCFLLSLWLYVSGPTVLIEVGGASGSMIGVSVRVGPALAQLAYFAAVVLLAVLLVGRPRPWSGTPAALASLAPAATAGVLVLGTASILVAQGPNRLQPAPEALVCVGTAPQVCVSAGYVRYAAGARAALLPYLSRLTEAGVPVPAKFAQDVNPGGLTVGPIESTLLLGRVDGAGFAVINSYLSKKCPIDQDPSLQTEWNGMISWLYAGSVPISVDDASIPSIVRGPQTPAQLAWVKATMAHLAACGR